MVFNFCGVKVFYRIQNNGTGPYTLLLHGWGVSGSIFDKFVDLMPERNFIILDFPPFGKSNIEPKDWNIFTYANMVISLCEHLKIDQVNVLGHSFGGRVAIILASLRPSLIEKCILVSSAGLKPKRTLKYHFKLYSYKLLRYFGFMINNAGSDDYKELSNDMKKVFVNVVSEHLDGYLPLIKQKTLIIYGEKDKETPVYMAKRLHKHIKNSRLEIIPEAGHFCFIDNLMTFYRLVDKFLEE